MQYRIEPNARIELKEKRSAIFEVCNEKYELRFENEVTLIFYEDEGCQGHEELTRTIRATSEGELEEETKNYKDNLQKIFSEIFAKAEELRRKGYRVLIDFDP